MNLLEQFVDFLNNQRDKPSVSTVKNYKADVRQFMNWFEKELNSAFDPTKATSQIINQYKKSRSLSANSIQRHASSLHKFFNFLNVKGIILLNPLEKQNAFAETRALEDPWKLKNFKNYLYEYKKSDLTIKNYVNDIKNFFLWLEEVSLVKNVWNVAEKNLLDKINFSIINEYKQRLIESNFSPSTINRKLSSLRNYIAWAKSQGLIALDIAPCHPEFISGSSARRQIYLRPNELLKRAQHDTEKTSYSSLPPIRLMQKSLRGIDFLFDNLLILPLAQTIESAQYLFWKSSGKKIFAKKSFANAQDNIANIKKEFYAPLDISSNYLPMHKKIWHRIKHVRPDWYKRYHSYSVTHYFHFAILIILSSAIGFGTYNGLFANARKQNDVLGTVATASPRILSFQGKLTDSQGNPINNPTEILFSIYDHREAPANDFLWKETDMVKPDSDGTFSALLGKNNSLPNAFFNQNSLFLGIKVGDSPELTPRQELATTSLAGNAQALQGLEPITNTVKTSNVVLALNSSGDLNIAGNKPHTFQVIGGNFILSGNVLSLITTPGSDSNVEIVPDGMGTIDLQKPIQNSSNNNNLSGVPGAVEFDDIVAILATSSAQSAFNINQNSIGGLVSANTNGIAKFTIANDGSGMFAGNLEINGNNLTSVSKTFNLLNTGVTTLNIGGEALSLVLGTASGSAAIKSSIILGNSSDNTIMFNARVAEDSSLVPITANGTNNLGSSSLPWDNIYTNNVYAVKLDIQDSQSATAAAQIFNTNTGTDADGLLLKLGNTSTSAVDNANHFISFETTGIGIVGSVRGNGGTGVQYQTSGIADFAEYLKKDKNQTIEYGSVVCMENNGLAVKCSNTANNIVGVASERPAFLGGENLGEESVAVGLVGQVETFVSISNGAIKAGDLLTASAIPGVAVKSTKAGQIVGKALEGVSSIDESKIVGFYDPDNKEYRSRNNFPDIPMKSSIIKIVKIYALVNVSWHDPSAYLTTTGELTISSTGPKNYSISSPLNQVLTNIGAFLKVASANIAAGLINAKEIVADSLTATTEIISPVVTTDRLYTNIISPLSPDSAIIINGNASVSGQLQANELLTNQLTTNDATVSGTLRADRILADSIEGIANFVGIASYSGQFAYVQGLKAEQAQFNQGLMVFGSTSVADLSVAGQLSMNGSMFIGNNSIEVLGTNLSLQSLRQGGLSIMGGLVYIDIDGNLKTQGNLSVAGKLAVSEDIVASGSGTFAKINFSLVQPALALSATESIASSSAGTAEINPHQTEITIRNAFATDKSVIYVTPVGTPSAQTPFLMRQIPHESFTVGIKSPISSPTPFNWLIVN